VKEGSLNQSIITRITAKGLNGRFDYTLPVDGDFSSTAILYGDNGVGKSTILRLVFHLLSPANNGGHRGALATSVFDILSVTLSSGVTLTADRTEFSKEVMARFEHGAKPVKLTIRKDDRLLAEWTFVPDRKRFTWQELELIEGGEAYRDDFIKFIDFAGIHTNRGAGLSGAKRNLRGSRAHRDSSVKRGSEGYLKVLADNAPITFFVNAERLLESDAIADIKEDGEFRAVRMINEAKKVNSLVRHARDIALANALISASRWVGTRVFKAANQGSTNVHAVYSRIVDHLARDSRRENLGDAHPENIQEMLEELTNIERRSTEMAKYEIATSLDMSVFINGLNASDTRQRQLLAELIRPYVQSVSSRLNALDPIYHTIDSFVENINSFLNGKFLTYRSTTGFSIRTTEAALEPSDLSSGEQQLILMFCYALTARDTPSVFMIDEPEISLNVKWQRKLLQSLADITSGSEIQFIFASHSLELISQHRHRVVKLEHRS
jgi:energy-coupling factor transporter ATP-binding protein EcfA2